MKDHLGLFAVHFKDGRIHAVPISEDTSLMFVTRPKNAPDTISWHLMQDGNIHAIVKSSDATTYHTIDFDAEFIMEKLIRSVSMDKNDWILVEIGPIFLDVMKTLNEKMK